MKNVLEKNLFLFFISLFVYLFYFLIFFYFIFLAPRVVEKNRGKKIGEKKMIPNRTKKLFLRNLFLSIFQEEEEIISKNLDFYFERKKEIEKKQKN